ncbi:isoprenoid synthase domain-containing protein [Mycena albidolilacea]|uniref:Terpene synthase n=1 Tax=Mycena albidolilacea TaxID=1033008 RepID=A0AAD7A227_9AGAR|nr:isoprenoid synthase domain-containing protein [Mycena albidolilacea]
MPALATKPPSSRHLAMENLPQTVCLPPLKTILAEFNTPIQFHPMKEEAKLQTIKWISSFENIDKKWLAIIMQAHVDDLAAMMTHDLGFDDLVLTMRWYFWAFLIDDTMDSQQLSPEGVKNILHLYEDVQRNRDLDASGPLPPIIAIFQSVWSKMREKKRPGFEGLFADASIDYVRGLPQVTEFRNSSGVPDKETYKRHRRINVFMYSGFHFTGIILDRNIDNALVCSAEMKQLYAHLIEICWLVNDILSWNMEQRSGDMWNFVSIIMIQDNKTVQEAMDDAEQELRSQVNQWWSAKTRVLEAYKAHQDIQALTLLIDRNQLWGWFAVEWTYNYAPNRYFGSHQASEEAQRTGIVHIFPRRQEKATHAGGNHS